MAPGDVVAVSLEPGRAWPDPVAETWAAGAALLPIDHRLPPREAGALIERARPTVSRVARLHISEPTRH
jgi:non-ribosomal peptide synthetase component F